MIKYLKHQPLLWYDIAKVQKWRVCKNKNDMVCLVTKPSYLPLIP